MRDLNKLGERVDDVNKSIEFYMRQLDENADDVALLNMNYRYLELLEVEFKSVWNTLEEQPWGFLARNNPQAKKLSQATHNTITQAIERYKGLLLSKTKEKMQVFKYQMALHLQLCIDNNQNYRKLFTPPNASLNILTTENTTAPLKVVIVLYCSEYYYDEKRNALINIIFETYGDKVFVSNQDEKFESLTLSVEAELLQPLLRIENDAQAVSTSNPVEDSTSVIRILPTDVVDIPPEVQELMLFCISQKLKYQQMTAPTQDDTDAIDILNSLYTRILNASDKCLSTSDLSRLRGLILSISMQNAIQNPSEWALEMLGSARKQFAGKEHSLADPLSFTKLFGPGQCACCAKVFSPYPSVDPTNVAPVIQLKEVLLIEKTKDYVQHTYEIGCMAKVKGETESKYKYYQIPIEKDLRNEIIKTGEFFSNTELKIRDEGIISRPESIVILNNFLKGHEEFDILSRVKDDDLNLKATLEELSNTNKTSQKVAQQYQRLVELTELLSILSRMKQAITMEQDGLVALTYHSKYGILKTLCAAYIADDKFKLNEFKEKALEHISPILQAHASTNPFTILCQSFLDCLKCIGLTRSETKTEIIQAMRMFGQKLDLLKDEKKGSGPEAAIRDNVL